MEKSAYSKELLELINRVLTTVQLSTSHDIWSTTIIL